MHQDRSRWLAVVTNDVMLLLSTGRSESQCYSHRLNHCLCMNSRHIISILELSHVKSDCSGFHSCWHSNLVVICLLVCSQWLVVAFSYCYYCLSDNQQWPCMHQGRGSRWFTIRLVYWQRQVTTSGIIHICASCIRGMRVL